MTMLVTRSEAELRLPEAGSEQRMFVFASSRDLPSGAVRLDEDGAIRYSPTEVEQLFAINIRPREAGEVDADKRGFYYELLPLAGKTPIWVRTLFNDYYELAEVKGAADIAAMQWANWYWNQNGLPARKLLPQLITAELEYLTHLRGAKLNNLNCVSDCYPFTFMSHIGHSSTELKRRFLFQQHRAWRKKVGTEGVERHVSNFMEAVIELAEFYAFRKFGTPSPEARHGDPEDIYSPYLSDEMQANYKLQREDRLFKVSRESSVLVASIGEGVDGANLLSTTRHIALKGIE